MCSKSSCTSGRTRVYFLYYGLRKKGDTKMWVEHAQMHLYRRKSPLKLQTMLNFCGRNVMQMRYFVRLSPKHSSNIHFLYSIQSLSFVFDFLFLWVEGILKYWASRLTN